MHPTLGSGRAGSRGGRIRVPPRIARRRQDRVKGASLRCMEPGRLRIYVGYASGVGKTYSMLDEARRRRARGTDVVLAFVEAHGRPEVAAQTRGLEVLARRDGARDDGAGEMDVDVVLARHPEVA